MENKFKKYMELTGLTEGVVTAMTSGETLTEEQENRIKFCMPSGVAKLAAGSIETLEEIIDEDIDGDGEIETAPEAGTIIVETTPTQSQDAGAGEGTDEGDGEDLDNEETTPTPTPEAGTDEGTVEDEGTNEDGSSDLGGADSDLEDPVVDPEQDW